MSDTFKAGDSFTLQTRSYDVTRTINEMDGMYVLFTTSYSKNGKECKPPVDGRLSLESFSDWAYKADKNE